MSSQRLRHVAVDDAQRQTLDDRRLADAGFADQHRVVLGAAREHLHGAANFFVAADHRIELALARRLGEIARIFLQGVVRVLGGSRIGRAAFAQILDGAVERLRRHAGVAQDTRGLRVLLQGERQQQAFHGDVGIARLLRDLLGVGKKARGRRREIELPCARAGDLRELGEGGLGLCQRLARTPARTVDETGGEPFRDRRAAPSEHARA